MTEYCDLNPYFKKSNKGETVEVYNVTAIKNRLLRLFRTGKGECPFNRNYGTTLKSLLFENSIDASTAAMFLYMDITTWEPDIELSPSDISLVQIDNHTYELSCSFTIPALNNTSASVSTEITSGK